MYLFVVGAVLLAAIVVFWLYGAFRAGLFIRDKHTPIAPPGPEAEPFSRSKQYIDLGWTRVAYVEHGQGDPLLLLHGCPFQTYEWKEVIDALAEDHRVIAPDLLGLGDTIVTLADDYRLPRQVQMVLELLDRLGIEKVHVVGHDHGGAIAQLLMDQKPERLLSVVLTNVEAYDAWPSEKERKDVELVVHPLTTPCFRLAIAVKAVQKWIYRIAVANPKSLTDDVLFAFVRPHIASARRWARLRRFFRWQLDRDHNLETARAVDGMRKFTKPTLLLWGANDLNFDLTIARRLESDIPGVVKLQTVEGSAHLPMLEQPEAYTAALRDFYSVI